jgi:hypothetical protein
MERTSMALDQQVGADTAGTDDRGRELVAHEDCFPRR